MMQLDLEERASLAQSSCGHSWVSACFQWSLTPLIQWSLTPLIQLDFDERATLAGKLLFSLDEPSATEVECLWLDEALRRLEDFRSGKVQSIPAEEVFRRAIAEIS